ncbi:MAG: hypothetical protein ACI4JB_10610 [Porcipelethomonas sp.]
MGKAAKIISIILITACAAGAVIAALAVYSRKFRKKYITVCE